MDRFPLLYLSCIFAGFSLLKVPFGGFLAPLAPLATLVGVLAIIIFACVIIFHGVLVLIRGRVR
jgi:hypothetical protein